MGYLASHWLPMIVPTKVSARAVKSLVVEHSERGLLLNYHDIRIGIFETLSTTEFYTAAFYIEQEIRRQQKRLPDGEPEDCDAMEISVSGLIEYCDRMLFDLGNPLDEIHTIVRLLAIQYLGGEKHEKAEALIRKAVGILWLFKDGCCELDVEIDKLRPKTAMSLQ